MKSVVKRIYFAIVGILAIIVSAAWNDLYIYFLPGNSIFNSRFFILAISLTAIVVFLIMYLIFELQREKTETLLLKHDNILHELHNSQKLAYTDTLTGIPN